MKLVACMHGKNNKDYFDQSLDEIKLLKFTNAYDPEDKHNIVRLYDFFYYKVRCSMVACVSGCLCDPEDQHNVIRLYDYFYCKVRGSMVALVCSSLMLLQHCSALFASRSQVRGCDEPDNPGFPPYRHITSEAHAAPLRRAP
eukprot:scaffold300432_cov18-Tisochrysis_lutea.AAC.1